MNKDILLIDDDADFLAEMLEFLEDSDFNVQAAVTPNDALALFKQSPNISIIATDILMPEMDGIELITKILEHKTEDRQLAILIVTGHAGLDNAIKALRLGAMDYIQKPVSSDLFMHALNRASETLSLKELARQHHQELKLAYEQLARQNEDLRKADELRKDVEQIYRHDLKSPISGIIGYSELAIKRKDLSDDIKEDFQIIKDSASKVFKMINLSLVILKIEQNAYHCKKESIEIITLLSTIRADLKAVKKNTINIILDGKPVTKNDEIQVEGENLLNYSLFSNLIKNALEASPDNSDITITINVVADQVSIAIHNYGVVPVEIREHFFDKYVTSGKKSGTGLGTYSAKLMVEAQGGTIKLDSSGNKSTTITVNLSQYKQE